MMHRVVHTSKSPFEIFILIAIVIAGIAGLLMPAHTSSAIAQLLPLWGQLTWYSGLLVSGLLSVVGAFTNRLWSLYAERGGLSMLGVLCVVYTATVIAIVGPLAAFAGVLVLGLGVACFARVHQISGDIRRVSEDLEL